MTSQIERFGNYVLLKKLASGGMAEIFLARPAASDADGRLLVIKRVLPHIAKQREFQKMFRREIQVLMGFTHPHIVQLHDFGIVDHQPYIAMEYIEGKSLRDINARLQATKSRLPMAKTLDLVAQAASGLHYAHTFEHKVSGEPLHTIHRDVSPQNLIVSFDGNLKVVDFGLAKAVGHDLTATGTIKGTLGYLSPEQIVAKNVDPRSDIFSLGVVAWELLTGERLFAKPGDTDVFILHKMSQCEKHVVPPSNFNRDIPFDVDRAILKALEKDPCHRYRYARDFSEELRRLLVKHCPNHVYANTGEMLRSLFKEDITNLRHEKYELSRRAKEMLARGIDDKVNAQVGKERIMAFRLARMEAALRQKATTRHYVLFAIYVVSIFALKFRDLHQIWKDYRTPTGTAVIRTVRPQPTVAMGSVIPRSTVAMGSVNPHPTVTMRSVNRYPAVAMRTVRPQHVPTHQGGHYKRPRKSRRTE